MKKQAQHKEIGHIHSFFSGVAKLQGLPDVFLHEVLVDEKGEPAALAIGFDENFVEALFFDEGFNLKHPVFRSNKIFSIPYAEDYLGRILDGIARPLDKFGEINGELRPVFREAPPLIDREPVRTPLSTGIKIIDTALPLGRGQRELIVGDRKLGKSTLAIDTVLNQKDAEPPIVCVYVLCGQKRQKLEKIINIFEKHNSFPYTVVVAATADSSFGELYLAPFVGCAIGEYFRDQGKDALVIYDDLSKHAKAYRDIALLLERAPGREAYPGNIFSLHAKLLERAGKLSKETCLRSAFAEASAGRQDFGEQEGGSPVRRSPKDEGGSLTALPMIETQEGDITAFIPTNLISITDGQIYFERGLFQKGFLPAVNVGLSVSRVGSQAQPEPLKEVTGGIRLALAQHKELQKLAQLETTKTEEAKKNIQRGELILTLLRQEKHTKVSWEEQAVLFYTTEQGHFDDLKKNQWRRFEELFLELLRNRYFETLASLKKDGFTDAIKKEIETIVSDFKKEFIS